MEENNSIKAIKILATGIENHITSLDIETGKNLLEYRLKDFLDIENIIKPCARCDRLFVPKFVSVGKQIYCGDDCRYNSTATNRKQIKQDNRYKKIDNLRKLIYERKYRAKKDNKEIPQTRLDVYNQILIGLKDLTRKRKHITLSQFNSKYNEIYTKYRYISKL